VITRTLTLLLAGASLTLGACATGGDMGPEPLTPTQRYSMEVKSEPLELRLAPHAGGLSTAQTQALGEFARLWVSDDGADVTVQSPSRAGDPSAAYRTSTDAREALIVRGVPAHRVRIVSYDSGDPQAPVVVGYMRYHAKGPDCGRAWEDVTANHGNRAYANFGCTITANMAAQIANPADVIAPHASDPADAGRRQTVLDHYRKGELTSSAHDEQANGAVSRVVP